MTRERRSSKLAASFVVVVAGACAKSAAPPEPRPEPQASITTQPDGSCIYYQSMSCPENATCNPPPPRKLDCPPDKRSENSRVLPEHDQRPAGKEGWLRFQESFWVGNQTCSYTTDQLCPPSGASGACVGAKSMELPCPAEPGGHLPRTVPAFKAERAAGGCVAYPEFRCETAGCQLPAPAFIDCSAELPQKPRQPETLQRSIFKDAGGACRLAENIRCPPGVACNPPPPLTIDCPPEQRDAARPGLFDDDRPPGKEKWLRVRAALHVSDSECRYQLDRFCPAAGDCDQYRDVTVACLRPSEARPQPPAGKEQFVHVPAFEVPRAAGRCFAYPALWCEPQRTCELPAARVVACKSELAR